MDKIEITKTEISGNNIRCDIHTEGKVSKAFRESDFTFSYECSISMDGIPESIAVLPALGTLVPLAWLLDAELSVEECDKDFVDSIPGIRDGYMSMYPELPFKGNFKVGKVCDNTREEASGSICLFSGGLDSHDTVLRHVQEKPTLLILRGADFPILENADAGWNEILRQVGTLADTLDTPFASVVTNFRRMLNYRYLNEWTHETAGLSGSYWYCFQHGIAMLTHTAPIAWQKKLSTVYIASSFTGDTVSHCASDPSIDEKLHFFGCKVIHDGYEYSRTDKMKNVIKWSKANDTDLYLRVCHANHEGKIKNGRNCCNCEKCFRTMLLIYALREDPKRLGFDIKDFDTLADRVNNKEYRLIHHFKTRYLPIIDLLHENYTREEIPESLLWFYDFKFDRDSIFFDMVDRRLSRDAETRVAYGVEIRGMERKEKRLRAKLEEYKERNKALKDKNKELKKEIKALSSSGLKHKLKKMLGMK